MTTSSRRLTNEIVDKRLLDQNRRMRRIGEYASAHNKILWECSICDNTWNATPASVLNLKSGCPDCFGNTKHNNKYIDQKIKGRTLRRVSDYINYDTPIEWKCEVCDHNWASAPNNVISKKAGCPICSRVKSGIKKSDGQRDRIYKILKKRNIILSQPYNRIVDNYDFRCSICEHTWTTVLNNIINSGSGCANCVGVARLTNDKIDQRLKNGNRPITRVGNCINATTKITWKCHKCEKCWDAVPDSVINAKSGCGICGQMGIASQKYFDKHPHKKTIHGYVYLIEGEFNSTKFLKVGITERTVEQRFKQDKKKYSIKVVYAKRTTLYNAYVLEQQLLQKYIKMLHRPDDNFGGKTECLVYDDNTKQSIVEFLMTD